jgi:hypothetical protein
LRRLVGTHGTSFSLFHHCVTLLLFRILNGLKIKLKLNVSSIEHSLLQGLAYLLPTFPLIPSAASSSAK